MPTSDKLLLLDAMALIYRAYYALNRNPRINSKGQNTSAILGFANTLTEALKKEQPTHIAVAFDSIAPTLREADFTDYKANREDMPEDIAASLPYIKELLDGFHIPVLALDGYEADDIIGTLAKKGEAEGYTVYMMTSDKDFGQLVSDNIFMLKPSRRGDQAEILGIQEVCEKYGIERPEQLIDILGLWGDASDNIPGVPGIGEVKAKKLVAEFGSVENLLENVEQVKDKRSRENLKENKEQALMSKNLATIILDVPVDISIDQFKRQDPDPDKLVPLFEELEFKTFAKRVFTDTDIVPEEKGKRAEKQSGQIALFEDNPQAENAADTIENKLKDLKENNDYHALQKNQDIEALVKRLKKAGSFCFDIETAGLDKTEQELVGIAFAVKPGEAFYVPFPEQQKEAEALLTKFKDLFEDPGIEKTGQNLKFDTGVLKSYGVDVKGRLFDTMLAHYLLQPDMRHNMDVLAETYLDYNPLPIESLIGKKGKSQKSMRSVPLETITPYACEDADITLQLRQVFEPMLKEHQLLKLFDEIETPLVPVLADMENTGVRIDRDALSDYATVLEKSIGEVEKEIYEMAGTSFNIGSPKQLGEVLFDRLKITDKAKKTKTKQYSTSEEVLSKLRDRHPIVEKILEYRSLTKLKSTYVDALPRLISENTGRIHTSFNQAVAATGRLSSNNPNLQNIPIRTKEGRLIRQAFVPRDKDYTLLAADYSQIELRLIASLSGDEEMTKAFQQGLDIHAATAANVFETPLEEITKEMRRKAKTVNFGIIYGISAFGLSERMGIPRQEAADIIAQYFHKYPGIKNYMDQNIAFAREHGYVSTMFGRRRYVRDINSANSVVRGYAERNAINAPVQGTAADMIKIAMVSIHEKMKEQQMKSKMILQVHDELVFDAHQDETDTLKPLIEEKMKTAIDLSVPVVVEMNNGKNWLEAH